jgi:hypothetical protein
MEKGLAMLSGGFAEGMIAARAWKPRHPSLNKALSFGVSYKKRKQK